MKKFMHNGIDVFYQEIVGQSFLDVLSKRNIIPVEIPYNDFAYRIYKYTVDGVRKYACCVTTTSSEYIEKVAITTEYPDDGFGEMMLDIIGQLNGETPRPVRSRLHLACRKARKNVIEYIHNKQKQKGEDALSVVFTDFESIEDNAEYKDLMRTFLVSYGYTPEIIKFLSPKDVDIESVLSYFE